MKKTSRHTRTNRKNNGAKPAMRLLSARWVAAALFASVLVCTLFASGVMAFAADNEELLTVDAVEIGLEESGDVESDDEGVYVQSDSSTEPAEFGGHFYQCINEHMSWHDAEEYCETQGGHLATVGSKEENDFIVSLVQEQTGRDFYWLGGTDEDEEGVWTWVTGEPWDYTSWHGGEPSNSGGDETGEDFLAMMSSWDGAWNDQWVKDPSYGELIGFVCEWETESLTVSAHVADPSGNAIWQGYTVRWYAANGKLLGTGQRLFNASAKTAYTCGVVLGEELSCQYIQPEDVSFTTGDQSQVVNLTLQPLEKTRVVGTVTNSDGDVVPFATLRLKQTFNGRYTQEMSGQADGEGAFSFEDVARTKTTLVATADGHYDGYLSVPMESSDGEVRVDVVLQKMPSNKITLTLYRQEAVPVGETGATVQLTNANGLAFTARNQTRGQDVTDLKVQYPYVILGEGTADPGDVIRLSATDQGGGMTAQDIEVTLDESRCAEAAWTLLQNGRVRVRDVSGNEESTVMVFDGASRRVADKAIRASYDSDPLPRGDYTLVFLKKTSALRSVDAIGRLAEAGLAQGADYALRTVSVEDGVVTVMDGVEVPDLDEGRFSHTVKDKTMLTANKNEAVAGQYVTMRASYQIDDKYDSAGETVRLQVPEGMAFVAKSLTVDGRSSSCTVTDDGAGGFTVSVPVNARSGTIRFYVLPTDPGARTTYAYLSFEGEDLPSGAGTVTEVIGSASVEVSAASIKVPKRTARTRVTASGKAIANCAVTVYDNGTPVGSTTSNKSGSWSLEFELVSPRKFSTHQIYATVTSEDHGVDIQTDVAELFYNRNYVEVSKVTMINTAHPATSLDPVEFRTVFDYLNPSSAVPIYNYWPSYPMFTFVVEFTDGATDAVSNVSVVTTDSVGDKTRVPCTYDEGDGVWIGTCEYTDFSNVPRKVAVSCNNSSGSIFDYAVDDAEMEELAATAKNLSADMADHLGDALKIENVEQDGNTTSFDVTMENERLFGYRVERLDYQSFDFEQWSDSHEVVKKNDGKGDVYLSFEKAGDASVFYTVDTNNRTVLRETLSNNQSPSGAKSRGIRDYLTDYSKRLDGVRNGYARQIEDIIWYSVCCHCCQNTNALMARADATAVLDQMMDELVRIILPLMSISWSEVPEPCAEDLQVWISIVESRFEACVQYYSPLIPKAIDRYKVNGKLYCDICDKTCRSKGCGCLDDDDDEDEDEDEGEDQPTDPIADPSGYVYEAVPSNRVEGVRAELYQYDYAVDEFGVPADQKSETLWDALSYDQMNPQYTGVDGSFGWDVPEGQWLVKFSKDGYEVADSHGDVACDGEGYLPVPPIQTEVNTAIVSTSAPEVANVAAYKDRVNIDFSQYMQIDSVCAAGAVAVSSGGRSVAGTVEPLDAEDDYKKTTQYASSYVFRAAGELSGDVTVSVGGVTNYAGTPIAQSFVAEAPVKVMPEAIVLTGADTMGYHASGEMEIQVLPKEAGANQTLTVTSYSPSIAVAEQQTVSTDAEGRATVTINAKLPGQAVFSVLLDGTKLNQKKSLVVGSDSVRPLDDGVRSMSLSADTFTYTGKEHKPTVAIEGLVEGVDFEVAYQNNVNAGTAVATAMGIGAYTGTLQREFTITQAANAITASDITLDASASKQQTRSLGAKATGGKLAYKSDAAEVAVDAKGNVTVAANYAGKATITITAGDANHASVTKRVTVTVRQINNAITVPAKITRVASAKAQSFSLGAKRKGKGRLSYASGSKKVTVSASGKVKVARGFVGSAKITVKVAASGIYKAASAKVSVVVNPPATKTVSVKAAKGGKAKVTWRKVALGGGYEVQYATNKKFSKGVKKVVVKKSSTVSATVKGLKAKKTYYVRVRVFKKVGSKTYYSAWSKSVKRG